jgi:hypothetical protein
VAGHERGNLGDILLNSMFVKAATGTASLGWSALRSVSDGEDVCGREKVGGGVVLDRGLGEERAGCGLNAGIQIPRQLYGHCRCEDMQRAAQVKLTRDGQLAADGQWRYTRV